MARAAGENLHFGRQNKQVHIFFRCGILLNRKHLFHACFYRVIETQDDEEFVKAVETKCKISAPL